MTVIVPLILLWIGLHLGAWLGFVAMIRRHGPKVACRNLILLALLWPVLVAWAFRSLVEPAWRGSGPIIPWVGGVILMVWTMSTAFALPMLVPASMSLATLLVVSIQPSALAIAVAIATRVASARTSVST